MTVRRILHVDMDAFFVSVELLARPELRGRPVIVGGSGPRGVVAAASYEARVYGISSAMPSVRARRLCPAAVFLPGDHGLYAEVSARVMALCRDLTPAVEPISLDEAFLDLSGTERSLGPPAGIAHRLRAALFETEGLTCSVGLAPNKFLAKLASEAAKPAPSREGPVPGRGVVVVPDDGIEDFLWPLPASALWGVGPATLTKLRRMGVVTVRDLARQPLERLVSQLGVSHGRHLHHLSRGIDDRPVVADQQAKSVSHEETFPADVHDTERLAAEVVRMSDAVASRLRRADTVGRTVTIKVRFGDFRTLTRSRTLEGPTDSSRLIARTARALLASVDTSDGVRLLGVGVSSLGEHGARQLSFDQLATAAGDGDADWRRAEDAVEAIRARFGDTAIGPARLLGGDGLRLKRRSDQAWGPGADERAADEQEEQ